jgi:4-methyl-5(b-hydroxyethyl)-thiazole monophosphate biosynthesis
MKKAFVFLAPGFEEVEASGTIDVLRRGEVDAIAISITGDYVVTGAHGIALLADELFEDIDFSDADALILPGGMPGSSNLNAYEPLKELLVRQYESGRIVAAICAAPLVLGGLGILKGRKATCYPGFESYLTGAILTDESVVTDGNVLTGKGPGRVFDFGLGLVSALNGPSKAEGVAGELLLL